MHIEFKGGSASYNRAPQVNAGTNQQVVLSDPAVLDGTATDDGQPGPVTTTWSKVSGPGTVNFGNANAVDTAATFSAEGSYVLRLTANDSELTRTDDVTIAVWTGLGASSTEMANTAASSDDAEESNSGVMVLSSSDLDFGTRTVGLRFPGVNLPQGATILSAYIQLEADESGSDTTLLALAGEAVDSSTTFATSQFNLTSRPTTAASVAWSVPAWTAGDRGLSQRTPNIAAIIQEIVSRPGWNNGGALSVLVFGTGRRAAESFDGNGAGPRLHIEYKGASSTTNQAPVVDAGTAQSVFLPNIAVLDGTVTDDGQPAPVTTTWSKVSGSGTVAFGDSSAIDTTAEFSLHGTYVLRLTAIDGEFASTDDVSVTVVDPGATVFEVSVVGGSNDVEESAWGAMNLTSNDLDLGSKLVGLRFEDVEIYPGATIVDAYIQFAANESGGNTTLLTLTGEAASNSPIFTASSSDVSSRPTTGASVSWTVPAWTAGQVGLNERTPNISSILQEIVASPDWTNGNALSIFVAGSGKRAAESLEGKGAAPKLYVKFNGGSPLNQAPQVDAGANQSVVLSDSTVLDGTVTDDGQPGPVTTTWTKVSGPGTVTFGNANAVDTTAAFSAEGSYIVRLTANSQ